MILTLKDSNGKLSTVEVSAPLATYEYLTTTGEKAYVEMRELYETSPEEARNETLSK